MSKEIKEKKGPESPELKVGDTPIDTEHEAGVAAGVKEAVKEETVVAAETDGTGPLEEPTPKSLTVKIKSKHQKRQDAFWKEQERKKKLAEEKAKK